MRGSSEYEWEVDDGNGQRAYVYLDIDWEATPYRPARVHGDPEGCYPAEGGEVKVYCVGLRGVVVGPEDRGLLDYDAVTINDDVCAYWLARFEKEEEPSESFQAWLHEQPAYADY